jgi:hypothetical protein
MTVTISGLSLYGNSQTKIANQRELTLNDLLIAPDNGPAIRPARSETSDRIVVGFRLTWVRWVSFSMFSGRRANLQNHNLGIKRTNAWNDGWLPKLRNRGRLPAESIYYA